MHRFSELKGGRTQKTCGVARQLLPYEQNLKMVLHSRSVISEVGERVADTILQYINCVCVHWTQTQISRSTIKSRDVIKVLRCIYIWMGGKGSTGAPRGHSLNVRLLQDACRGLSYTERVGWLYLAYETKKIVYGNKHVRVLLYTYIAIHYLYTKHTRSPPLQSTERWRAALRTYHGCPFCTNK